MSAAELQDHSHSLESKLLLHPGAAPSLRVVIAYQDAVIRDWATEVWERVSRVMSGQGSLVQSWQIDDLVRPNVFPEAVMTAAEADLIFVGVRVAEALPVPLYVWVTAWLPRRKPQSGALAALLATPDQATIPPTHPDEYFRAVARRAGMDYLPRDRKFRGFAEPIPITVPRSNRSIGQRPSL